MTTWKAVHEKRPPPGGVYRVARRGLLFDATVCYGMHEPWWIPRNGYTLEESQPIQMLVADIWHAAERPFTP